MHEKRELGSCAEEEGWCELGKKDSDHLPYVVLRHMKYSIFLCRLCWINYYIQALCLHPFSYLSKAWVKCQTSWHVWKIKSSLKSWHLAVCRKLLFSCRVQCVFKADCESKYGSISSREGLLTLYININYIRTAGFYMHEYQTENIDSTWNGIANNYPKYYCLGALWMFVYKWWSHNLAH